MNAEERFRAALDSASHPVELPGCFISWLRAYWLDSNESEALSLWEETVRESWWDAAECIRCLDATLQNPADNFDSLIREHGGMLLQHELPDGYYREYTRGEYIAWLGGVRDRFAGILNTSIPGSG
ncbi:hypothetical protein [Streptomyces atratus]|uniref:hypothetical protein n=1 Tax=Streptomyces atratus TaxID=1893 RepID=UPI0032452BE0